MLTAVSYFLEAAYHNCSTKFAKAVWLKIHQFIAFLTQAEVLSSLG
jgi:hypothetical protein